MAHETNQYRELAAAALRGRLDDSLAGSSLSGQSFCGDSLAGESMNGDSVGGLSADGAPLGVLSGVELADVDLPDIPAVGLAESHYARLARHAERRGDQLARSAAKVGQYVTLALDPSWPWRRKRRSFDHCLRRHCRAPGYSGNGVWQFYRDLAGVVRLHAGQEAVRLACQQDDAYDRRRRAGASRKAIRADAEPFFAELLCCGDDIPKWFTQSDFRQLRMIRGQWV